MEGQQFILYLQPSAIWVRRDPHDTKRYTATRTLPGLAPEMSYRHTYITEFLYKSGKTDELILIEDALVKYGTVHWSGRGDGLGYFHGVKN